MAEYDFRTLSPTDFEHLSRDVLNAALGLRLRSYPEGRDQGIDLREVTPDGHTTIVQCKHYARTATAGFMKAVKGEVAKPARRMADRYIFVTSHALTAARETEVARILGVPVADVWGPDALNAALAAHPDIERRHFKLWLSSVTALIAILRAGLWQRSDALLMEVAESAKYWVETSALSGLAELLEREGVCVVTGMPGIGKTMLADMTALTAARAGWQVVQPVGGTTDAWATWRPETRQLFYLDDFIGGRSSRRPPPTRRRTGCASSPTCGGTAAPPACSSPAVSTSSDRPRRPAANGSTGWPRTSRAIASHRTPTTSPPAERSSPVTSSSPASPTRSQACSAWTRA